MRRSVGSLAGLRAGSYLALIAGVALVGGCRSKPPALGPEVLAYRPLSAEAFADLARRTTPAQRELIALRWRFADPSLEVAGRGAARVAPPDSLRIDVRGPLGFGRGTLVLAGESAWAEPASLVRQVLPSRFMVWAMLGVVRAPDAVARIESAEADGRRFVRLAQPDGLHTVFELHGDTVVGVTQESAGRQVGWMRLVRDAAGLVRRAEAEDKERDARLVFTIERRSPSGRFPDAVWRRP